MVVSPGAALGRGRWRGLLVVRPVTEAPDRPEHGPEPKIEWIFGGHVGITCYADGNVETCQDEEADGKLAILRGGIASSGTGGGRTVTSPAAAAGSKTREKGRAHSASNVVPLDAPDGCSMGDGGSHHVVREVTQAANDTPGGSREHHRRVVRDGTQAADTQQSSAIPTIGPRDAPPLVLGKPLRSPARSPARRYKAASSVGDPSDPSTPMELLDMETPASVPMRPRRVSGGEARKSESKPDVVARKSHSSGFVPEHRRPTSTWLVAGRDYKS